MTGRLFCIEGIDGAGKTTLVKSLVSKLADQEITAGSLPLRSLFERDLGERWETGRGPELTNQEKAFVSYSRLYEFYLTEIVPALERVDILLLDRFKWSFVVRWGCRNVRPTVLSALAAMPGMLPDPAHTLLITADPYTALSRKLASGVALTAAETGGSDNLRTQRDAFIALQTRASELYEDLYKKAASEQIARIDSKAGADAVLAAALQQVHRVLQS